MMATVKKSAPKSGSAKKSASSPKKRATEKKPAPTKKATAKPAPAKSVASAVASSVARTVAKAVAKATKPAAKPSKPAPTSKAATKESATSTPPRPAARAAAAAAAAAKPARTAKKGKRSVVVVTAGSNAASKLGTKWNCFRCGAKFYDLNKPEPLCPKCGADQRERPKVVASPPTPAPQRKQPRPMAPLLEDEDDGSVRYEEDIDLAVRAEADEPDEDLFQPGEFEEDEPFGGAEEE